MIFSSTHATYRIGLALMALVSVAASGCNVLQVGSFNLNDGTTEYVGVDQGFEPQHSSLEVYQKVRQAKAQNAIVLQLPDDDNPVRVLPLPTGERSVFVSDLLKQTGVQKKLGNVEVNLYRPSAGTIDGFRMSVTMARDGETVRPESDYALRAGDRLTVQKKSQIATLDTLASSLLGL